MSVLLEAAAVYISGTAPWQREELSPRSNIGVPTVGVTTTERVTAAEGPLHPFAVTLIVAVPEYPFAQVITPVIAFITPAPAGSTDQLKPVLLAAVVA